LDENGLHLRQAEEGTAVGEICRKAGISEATYYDWRKKYADLTPSEMKRLRRLEEENGKLKKIVADLSLHKAVLRDVIHEPRRCGTKMRGAWRRDYNEEQPHSAIGNRVPIELVNRSAALGHALIQKTWKKPSRVFQRWGAVQRPGKRPEWWDLLCARLHFWSTINLTFEA
jgi:putative transposase